METKSSTARLVLSRVRPALASLDHVVRTFDACAVSTNRWTLESASKAGCMHLLSRLLTNKWPELCRDFRESRFLYDVALAAQLGDTDLLHWRWTRHLLGYPEDVAILIARTAVFNGHVHVLQWLYDVDGHVQAMDLMQMHLRCSTANIVHWFIAHRRHLQMEVLV